MFPARSTRGRDQGTSPSGRRARKLQVPPFFSAAWGVASHSCQFLGDSLHLGCASAGRGEGRGCSTVGVRPRDGSMGAGTAQGLQGPTAQAAISENSQTKFHALNLRAAILLRPGFIIGSVRNPSHLMCSCQHAVRLLATLRGRCWLCPSPCPSAGSRECLVLTCPLPQPTAETSPNRCCPARCWEWLRQERCSSCPFQTPTPRHSTCQELSPPIWSSGLGTPGLLSHPGAAGCSCGFLYEEAGVFAPKGCGPRCHHRPGWYSRSITPPCLMHRPAASPAAMVTLMDVFLFGNLFPSHSFSATT
ncbi:uncharacterized protein LOC128141011 [Harpia harpyja]|uniref:uncharacterized protein LOC128141011 n=1 Tax=Harpia harpyja TaxID=202280 RepID=UPI0022B14F2C|nr:uncharacterized protein LOC128141011 [Harpia harpyja]XP_052641497.1 uncharacterized protein LOC128141011 [Harpia harpyja]